MLNLRYLFWDAWPGHVAAGDPRLIGLGAQTRTRTLRAQMRVEPIGAQKRTATLRAQTRVTPIGAQVRRAIIPKNVGKA